MELEFAGNEESMVIKISGELLADNCPLLRDKVLELCRKNCNQITLDMQDMQFIDSAGLGVLIGLKSTMIKRKGQLSIINLNQRIQEIFHLTHIDKLFGVGENSA